MPRSDHRFVITLHDRWTGEKFTAHLVQADVPGRYWPKYKGRNSRLYHEITGTELGRKVTGWLKDQQSVAFCPWDVPA